MSNTRKSAKYLFYGNLLIRFITFASSIIIARLLCPDDYGYLLMVSVVTGFIGILGNAGFENFYLQEKINEKDQQYEKKILNITYKLRILLSILLFSIQIIASYPVSKYYHRDVIGELLRLFAWNYLITGMVQVNIYVLRKKIDFRPEVYGNIVKNILDSFAKIFFAYSGFGALSFAYGSIIGNVGFFVVILLYQRFVPDLWFWDNILYRKIYYYGKHYFISAIFGYFSSYIDKIILMNHFPTNILGYYNFSYAQADNIRAKTSRPMGKLIISYIAKNKDNYERLQKAISNITYFELMVFTPIYIYFILYASPIVEMVFGQKWLAIVPLFQIFMILGLLTSLSGAPINILTGLGYPSIQSKLSIANLIVMGTGLYLIAINTQDIKYYAILFVSVNIFFYYLKSSIGLIKINYKISRYLYDIKITRFILLGIMILIIINYINNIGHNVAFHMILSLVTIIFLSIIFHLILFKKDFLTSLGFILGDKHFIIRKISNNTNKRFHL